MKKSEIYEEIKKELEEIKDSGLFKSERIIASPQGASIKLADGTEVLNFCANNYLGLSSSNIVTEFAKSTINTHGYGMSSVRFICGTLDIHKELESKIAEFLGKEDAILYSSAFDANGGLFEPLLGADDAIVSDKLNHASIIDGIRLCKAKRYPYENNNMADLEAKIIEAKEAGAKRVLIATDGVFSMDGIIADVDKICELGDKYDAMVMIDDSHATGFVGKTGRGSHEHCGVFGKPDVITGTFGKALGGASGGFIAANAEVVELLRQRSRPYLFSNSLAPGIVGATLNVLDNLTSTTELRDKLEDNTKLFRDEMTKAGFDIVPGVHPIVPIMLYDAKLSQEFANKLLAEGIYVIGFFYPVVPKGKARIRVQISAAHSEEQIIKAVKAFTKIGKELDVIK
ncbi:MAG: glycine C-acetyltransferase [Saprospiraceae bacterium]